jgi:uncharacterized protein YlxW (UPF0749 family)
MSAVPEHQSAVDILSRGGRPPPRPEPTESEREVMRLEHENRMLRAELEELDERRAKEQALLADVEQRIKALRRLI